MKTTTKRFTTGGMTLVAAILLGTGCANGRFKDPADWNKKERGALIGGVGGAAVGTAVGSQSGNAGAGAIIGGAAGAGAGGVIGNEFDKDED